MCQDGACYRDPALEGVRCLGSGANCGYCKGGICTATNRQPCEDGVCPRYGECCPEKRQCADKTCVPADQCCDDEYKCPPDGPCVGKDQCCPGEKRCPDPGGPTGWACVDENACCPDERRCGDRCISKRACCSGEKPCGSGCIGVSECCEAFRPACHGCSEAYCDNGIWNCRLISTCCPFGQQCPDLPDYCCGDHCIPQGQCCGEPPDCGPCAELLCTKGLYDHAIWECRPNCPYGCCQPGVCCPPP